MLERTPTWETLEEIVGLLEEGDSVAFASGMAGIAAVFDQLHAGSRPAGRYAFNRLAPLPRHPK